MILKDALERDRFAGHTRGIQTSLQPVNKDICKAPRQIDLYCPIMAEGIGDRIKKRRQELKLSQPALARKVGGITYQAIQAVERGGRTSHLIGIARALEVEPQWLETGHGSMEKPTTEPQPAVSVNYLENNNNSPLNKGDRRAIIAEKIAVLGMAECGPDGMTLWNGEIVDRVDRPTNLAGVANAYAVFIQGDSMEPRYHPGEVAFIHPGRPVTPGAYVLVQLHAKDGGAPRAFLKRLVKRSGDKVVLEQFNPKKTFTLKQSEILSTHRVVGSGEA